MKKIVFNPRSPWQGIRNAARSYFKYDALLSQSVAVHKRSQYDRNASLGTLWYRRLLTALLILIPSRGYWFFENLRGSIEDKFPCRYFLGMVKSKN